MSRRTGWAGGAEKSTEDHGGRKRYQSAREGYMYPYGIPRGYMGDNTMGQEL